MKKKLFVILGAVFIVAVIGAVLFFVLRGGKEQPTETMSFKGAWVIYQHGEEFPKDQFMVFEDNKVSYYKTDYTTPAASSSYSIDKGKLNAPDLNRKFTIQVFSENDILLTEENTLVWRILRVGDTVSDIANIKPDKIEGKYDVVRVAEEYRNNESMTFTDSHLSLVQGGQETISSDYYISEDGIIHLTTIEREFDVYTYGDNLYFVGLPNIVVWELKKTN